MFNQGGVMYSTKLRPHKDYKGVINVHDFGLFYVNNELMMVLNRSRVS